MDYIEELLFLDEPRFARAVFLGIAELSCLRLFSLNIATLAKV